MPVITLLPQVTIGVAWLGLRSRSTGDGAPAEATS
jgi:hypothetical protein